MTNNPLSPFVKRTFRFYSEWYFSNDLRPPNPLQLCTSMIGSAPAYRVRCALPPHPIYQTLLFNFLRIWFRD